MSSMYEKESNDEQAEQAGQASGSRPWVPPTLTVVGSITEVIRSTPGKAGSSFDGDMFSTRKPGGGG